jgi:superkiller protein 3
LTLLLPDQPFFALIERHIPPPGEVCESIATSLEILEQEMIDKEIEKRRMRLGANLEQVSRDVKREVFSRSEVPALFKEAESY